jgi:cell wall-associated NlpC family hydrolase
MSRGFVLAVVVALAAGVSACGRSGAPSRPGGVPGGTSAAGVTRQVSRAHPVGARIVDANGVALAPDPEEKNSFPEPANAPAHAAARTPSQAAQAAISPGAPSDAEIRRELHLMHDALAAQRAAAQAQLSHPVPGGYSVGGDGTISPPPGLPQIVDEVIAGGNAIADFPYRWGGGHGSFVDDAYDCSGSVSYALAAGGLLGTPLVSGDLAHWGAAGPGRYITVFANAGHTFMNVAGMWFDTAGRSGPYASRWITATPSLAGYAVRHWPGL